MEDWHQVSRASKLVFATLKRITQRFGWQHDNWLLMSCIERGILVQEVNFVTFCCTCKGEALTRCIMRLWHTWASSKSKACSDSPRQHKADIYLLSSHHPIYPQWVHPRLLTPEQFLHISTTRRQHKSCENSSVWHDIFIVVCLRWSSEFVNFDRSVWVQLFQANR